MNASMPALKEAFEKAGFSEVRTVISSGNVAFDARKSSPAALERKAEAAMSAVLGRTFLTIVRPMDALGEMLARDPYRAFQLGAAKRIVTFLRGDPPADVALPVELDGARLLTLQGRDLFGAYLPGPKGPVFMTLIERTFGKDVTTRTWNTVAKVARA